jgi:hypothetical protein
MSSAGWGIAGAKRESFILCGLHAITESCLSDNNAGSNRISRFEVILLPPPRRQNLAQALPRKSATLHFAREAGSISSLSGTERGFV